VKRGEDGHSVLMTGNECAEEQEMNAQRSQACGRCFPDSLSFPDYAFLRLVLFHLMLTVELHNRAIHTSAWNLICELPEREKK